MLIKDYIPPFLFENIEFKSMLNVCQSEVDNINIVLEDIANQSFISTATWGLEYWERLLDIKVDKSKDIKLRREIIKSALTGHGTVTVQLIKDTAEAFAGEVEINENIEPFTFEVKFMETKGFPFGLEDLKKRIDIIKPAHLIVKYTFTYNTWRECHDTWRKTKNEVWKTLKVRVRYGN